MATCGITTAIAEFRISRLSARAQAVPVSGGVDDFWWQVNYHIKANFEGSGFCIAISETVFPPQYTQRIFGKVLSGHGVRI